MQSNGKGNKFLLNKKYCNNKYLINEEKTEFRTPIIQQNKFKIN